MKVKAPLNSSHEENYYFLNVINEHICRHINIYAETYRLGSEQNWEWNDVLWESSLCDCTCKSGAHGASFAVPVLASNEERP